MSKKKGKSVPVAPSQPQEVFEIVDEVVETPTGRLVPAPSYPVVPIQNIPVPRSELSKKLSLKEQAATIGLEYPLPEEVWKWPCKYCGKGLLKDKSTPSPLLNDGWDRCFGMAHAMCWFTETSKELEADGTSERNRKLREQRELDKIAAKKKAEDDLAALSAKRRSHIQRVNEQRRQDKELAQGLDNRMTQKVLVQQQSPKPSEIDASSLMVLADDEDMIVEEVT